ncbi:multiple organellar RNA editing factor 8, chloroplastic/mitochondrial-like protein [Cinnamomum micranthum f. kanehirae]|uniref:Multiple organellar RNA editing factor 8, chloroplastic/mitochondrial-like protein n=1 Tax=Cinnamomum micranthum f. kanehirae TaxID=337451 RepID=A0A443PMJ0_9MAGN|nr:multiple organellar RNA editing factor 8, chloroplastic/mitochondrial-like protein [Cinnamomum micranthum f. kanehirae]
MAMYFLARAALIPKPSLSYLSPLFPRSFATTSASFPLSRLARSSPLVRLRPITTLSALRQPPQAIGLRCFSTRPTTSSLNDPSPNWSNRPPKETILLDGCDFEHWLIVMEPPEGNPTRDEIIDSYIKTLAQVVGSEEEARMKIYSVSTRHYYAFGCLVSEELSYKIKPLPKVRWVLPDSYLDVKNKDYGGEPFINGEAVPYDPKYHEEWVRNNARANERSRRNDRPRNFDRSRNFERRRENMQNRDFQSRDAPQMPNRDVQNSMPPRDMPGMGGGPSRDMGPSGRYPNMPPTAGPAPPSGGPSGGYPNMPNSGAPRYSNMPPSGGPSGPGGSYSNVPNNGGQNGGYSNTPPSGVPSGVYSNMPPSGGPSGGGYSNSPHSSGPGGGGYPNMPNSSGSSGGYNMPNGEMGSVQNRNYQNSYAPNRDGGVPSNTYEGRDLPGRDY